MIFLAQLNLFAAAALFVTWHVTIPFLPASAEFMGGRRMNREHIDLGQCIESVEFIWVLLNSLMAYPLLIPIRER